MSRRIKNKNEAISSEGQFGFRKYMGYKKDNTGAKDNYREKN